MRERLLPVLGKVNARVNQRVNPTDIVAEANFAREHVLLDVARTFGISAVAADKLIRVKEGDRLTEGALVAEKSGLFGRSVKAPRAQWLLAVRRAKLEQAFYLTSHRVIPFLDQFTPAHRVGWKLKWTSARIDDDSQRAPCDCD